MTDPYDELNIMDDIHVHIDDGFLAIDGLGRPCPFSVTLNVSNYRGPMEYAICGCWCPLFRIHKPDPRRSKYVRISLCHKEYVIPLTNFKED